MENYKNSFTKRWLSILLMIVMVLSTFTPFTKAAYAAPAQSTAITDEDLAANAYETYYYTSDMNYTYNGDAVTFIDEAHFIAGDQTYDLKNKKTNITVETADDGTISVSLSDLSYPVGQISGKWNSTAAGGAVNVVYQTDIPGMAEVRSAKLNSAITLSSLSAGTYHLTDGTIYEKANPYSPGYDFGDGKGVVTEGYFGTLPDITIVVGGSEQPVEPDVYLGDKTEAKVYDDFENDIWLQYQQKEMKVGDTANLRPWRVPQIVTDVINNDVARPQFNFEIISGDSISLSTTKTDDKAVVTAEKPGTTVVKVTYDALDYKGQHWDPSSAVNTGYAVYTVGEEGTAAITCSDELTNWRHYDTIYYNEGETTPYNFTVDTTGAESVKVTCNGIEIEGDGNQYTANLENRSNIIGVVTTDAGGKTKSFYRVIDARFIEINIKNKTNEGQPLKAGDTANVSFKGITMPVYKLATIYNPQMGKNATCVTYENDTLGSFKGKCGQWDLATKNSFDVAFDQDGEYTFTSEDGIFCAWWGSELGADITAEGSGEPNLNAPTLQDNFSKLPDFTVSVGESIGVDSIVLDKTELNLSLNESAKLTATIQPENATHPEITWTTSDENVAKVDSAGNVTAVNAGTAEIKAAADGKKATCTIKVRAGTIDEVNKAIAELPKAEAITLRDKTDVEQARLLYDNLSKEDQAKVSDLSKLEAAEAKINELIETPFMFSLNGKLLNVVNTGEETGYRGYVYKVEVPKGTETVQLERYKDIAVMDKSYQTLIPAGQTTVDIETAGYFGRDNIFITNHDMYYYNWFYFEAVAAPDVELKAEVSPDEILPGTEVTVNFTNLEAPVTEKDPVHTMQTKYQTNIPGLAQVASKEAKNQEELINTLTFTIPEDTEPGTYYLTDGCVYKEWGGTLVQGIFWVGKESQEFYKGQMPDIEIVVGDPNAELKAEAQKVTDQINALGEITLDKEDAVKAARSAYDALDKKAKAYVTEETLSVLADAEMKIKDLKPVIGQVTISVERFTIGQGYYKEPVNVALKEGNTCSDIIRGLIGSDNYIGQPNYLSAIKGADLGADKVDVPEYISKYFNGPTTEEALLIGNSDENLGEFDYSQGSGWYYFVNNEAPSVGINDRIPEDGDVIRLQFTLAYGNDLKGDESYIIANKDGLTKALADFNGREDKEALLTDQAVQTAYDNAVAAAQIMGLSQEDTDMAATALNSAVVAVADREAAQNVEDMITALPPADKLTLGDKEVVKAARAAYNGLTEAQRGYVSDDILKLLETAEAQIANLEENPTPTPEPTPTPTPTPTPVPGTNPNGGNGSNGSGTADNTSTGVISDSAAAVWASIAFIAVAAGLTGAVVIRRRGKSE
ncbi:Ig-like domain-containing protein [Eubacterium limosum]|uniref:Ig-like domain-containing protein n=1 Tax=Eubacterium limosum TaxID=1736 RepID=A0ABT5UTG9_EUBLI|nr:Ig-like domain-containing protein [Eubacterium limosum]MCB6571022.1 Ig-like domain-containing protein [Eubacterium limosum]MDE1472228.1 Ig-like domain-containing protein [Eubacterium limosum]